MKRCYPRFTPNLLTLIHFWRLFDFGVECLWIIFLRNVDVASWKLVKRASITKQHPIITRWKKIEKKDTEILHKKHKSASVKFFLFCFIFPVIFLCKFLVSKFKNYLPKLLLWGQCPFVMYSCPVTRSGFRGIKLKVGVAPVYSRFKPHFDSCT